MPFRLLGLAARPADAGDLCGRTFARYAASGTDVTLVCAAAHGSTDVETRSAAERLGVRNLVLLDYRPSELTASALEDVFADVMASVRPHVVVADATRPAVREASASAFSRIRRASGRSGALPLKLYFRPSAETPSVRVTTAIAVPMLGSPELFTRAYPDPWVTGVVERDLFAGISADGDAAGDLPGIRAA